MIEAETQSKLIPLFEKHLTGYLKGAPVTVKRVEIEGSNKIGVLLDIATGKEVRFDVRFYESDQKLWHIIGLSDWRLDGVTTDEVADVKYAQSRRMRRVKASLGA